MVLSTTSLILIVSVWCSTVTRLKLKNYTNSVSHWIIRVNLHHKMLKRSCERCRFDLSFHNHTSWMCETFSWIEREQDHASRWRDTHYLSSWHGSTRRRCAVALRVEKCLIDWFTCSAGIRNNNDHVERYETVPWNEGILDFNQVGHALSDNLQGIA